MVSLSNHVAISLRLNTRRQTTNATATRLPPPYQVRGRNDRLKWVVSQLTENGASELGLVRTLFVFENEEWLMGGC